MARLTAAQRQTMLDSPWFRCVAGRRRATRRSDVARCRHLCARCLSAVLPMHDAFAPDHR